MYSNSITEQTNSKMNTWVEELEEANSWFEESTTEEIFKFINDKTSLYTPGFVLRRQIQTCFPELIGKAEEQSNVHEYADLRESGNTPLPKSLVNSLSRVLSETNFKGYGHENLNIEFKQWKKYLNDEAFCNRSTAIKLLFALQMNDDVTIAKFFLSNGNELLSMRNPFDYACTYCLKCNLTYEDVVEVFDLFESQRDSHDSIEPIKIDSNYNFTESMKNETISMSVNVNMSNDEKKNHLLSLMLEHKNYFTKKVVKKNHKEDREEERAMKYAAGYSLHNMKMLQLFLKYLVVIYPEFYRYTEKYNFFKESIKTDENGIPKVYEHLTRAMVDKQNIDLPEYSYLDEYDGPELASRGSIKRFYDNIPFNKNIVIPLKSLSKTLRSILRAVKYPTNAQAVNRDTIMLLTYFFITGYRSASETMKNKIKDILENDINSIEEEHLEDTLIFTLSDIINNIDEIDDGEENAINGFISSINYIMTCFDLHAFYSPFVLDRFILLCLLATKTSDENDDDSVEYLMQLVIYESYRLSKEIIEEQ